MAEPVKVTRQQVLAARVRIATDQRLGRPTPEWVKRLADAQPAPARQPRHKSADTPPAAGAASSDFPALVRDLARISEGRPEGSDPMILLLSHLRDGPERPLLLTPLPDDFERALRFVAAQIPTTITDESGHSRMAGTKSEEGETRH